MQLPPILSQEHKVSKSKSESEVKVDWVPVLDVQVRVQQVGCMCCSGTLLPDWGVFDLTKVFLT